MRIEHFQYLVNVIETGSINQSAENLYISQQGLSQAIQQMEKELDISLFYRNGNKLLQTEAGKITEDIARDIINKYNELITALKPYINSNEINSNLREINIYSPPIINVTLLPKVLNIFHRKYQNIKIKVIEKSAYEIVESIKTIPNSVGLLSLPLFELEAQEILKDNLINFEELYRCKLMAAVAKSSPLAANKHISNNDLLEQPLSIFNVENRLLDYILESEEKPNIIISTTNLYLAKETIASGMTIGFTNDFVDKFFKNLSIVSIPLIKDVDLIFGSISPKNIPENSPMKDFLNILKKEFKTQSKG